MAVCVLVVLGFYVRCGVSYGKTLAPADERSDFQNLQADAFLAGQLNLRIEAPEGLLALDNPYDAAANEPYRALGLHDLTFYDGKLFTYFGPAPVVIAYVPFRSLQLGELSPALATLLFCSGGFLMSVGVFRIMARRFLRPLSVTAESVAILALGLAAPMGWLISIGRGYEVAIACGYFLAMSGLYFLSKGLFGRPDVSLVYLVIGSAFLASTVAARPNLFWILVFVPYALAYVGTRSGRLSVRRAAWAALLAPPFVVALLLAWYNWARFGSPTELGTNYMLLGENVRIARANEFGFLRTGLFEYLLSPGRVTDDFPWFRLRPYSMPWPTEINYLREPVAGLLTNMPATMLGIVAFAVTAFRKPRRFDWLSTFIFMLTAVGLTVVAVSSFHFHSVTMRYQIDYAPMLLLASVLGWFVFSQRIATRATASRVASFAAVAVVGWSCFFSIAITAYPCAGTGSC